jgi:CheY-like chemotaxis protein
MARVLVVEDEPTDRVILAELLERMGHDVYFASDGEEAFKTYLQNRLEIVITDLNMPHVDGLEFIGAVKALFPQAVIIAVSGKGPDQLDAARSAGALVALSKPIDPQELREAIAEVAPRTSLGRSKEDVGIVAPNDEPLILILEDDPDQAMIIQAAFRKNLAGSRTHIVLYGWEAQAYLDRVSPYHDWTRYPIPSLIVLDLGLPDMSGFEILEWMAESKWLEKIPVIVFTASEDLEHEQRAYALGVRRYMRKPGDYGALVDVAKEQLRPRIETEQRKVSDQG